MKIVSQPDRYKPGLVSYILPAYNGEAYIAEAVTSILSQTYDNIELIVVNDGSTDSTEDALQSVSDPRLTVIKQKNLGISHARNNGIAAARGEFIGSASQDDIFEPDKTERQVEFLRSRDMDMSFTWIKVIGEARALVERKMLSIFNKRSPKPEAVFRKLLRRNFLSAPSFLGRRECYAVSSWRQGLLLYQDCDLWLQMCGAGMRCGMVEAPLLHYRAHFGSLSFNRDYPEAYREIEKSTMLQLALELTPKGRSITMPGSWLRRSDWPLHITAGKAEELASRALAIAGNGRGNLRQAHALAVYSLNKEPLNPSNYLLLADLLDAFSYRGPADTFRRISAHLANQDHDTNPSSTFPARNTFLDRL